MKKSNPIGSDTRNMTLNSPKDWASELGKEACRLGLSLGEYLRRLIEAGMELENPGCALRLRNIRRQYYGAVVLLLIAYIALMIWRPSGAARPPQFRFGTFTLRASH